MDCVNILLGPCANPICRKPGMLQGSSFSKSGDTSQHTHFTRTPKYQKFSHQAHPCLSQNNSITSHILNFIFHDNKYNASRSILLRTVYTQRKIILTSKALNLVI